MLVKEINVPALREPLGETEAGQKFRPDWKKGKSKKKVTISFDSPSQPLLGSPEEKSDVEAGVSQYGMGDDGTSVGFSPDIDTSSCPGQNRKPGTPSYAQMQYARMPGQSLTSLFGEDDNVVPEDVATAGKDMITVSAALDRVAEQRPGLLNANGEENVEAQKQLKLRPLPEDATDERDYRPPRKRAGEAKRSLLTAPALSVSTYRSTAAEAGDVGDSEGDEEST